MSAEAANAPLPQLTPNTRGLRIAQWIRVVCLVAIGAAITFTPTQHQDASFTLTLLAVSLVALGLVTGGEYVSLRSSAGSWLVAVRAAVAVIAGVVAALLITTVGATDYGVLATQGSVLVAVWALLTAATSVLRVVKGAQPANVGYPSAIFSALLAVLVLLFHDDFVAMIGFFGAYAIMRAVFLGIAVFDMKKPAEVSAATHSTAAHTAQ